jgi:hypothetical protein
MCPDFNWPPVTVAAGTSADVTVIASVLPTGASTALNQTTGNASLATIATNTTGLNDTIAPKGTPSPADALQVGVVNAAGNLIPIALGPALEVASIPVTLATDQPAIPVTITGGGGFPALQNVNITEYGSAVTSLGAKTSAFSMPVVLATDEAALPVTGTFFQATQPVSGTVTVVQPTGTLLNATIAGSALPTGASTAALQSSVQGTVAAGAAATNSELIGGVFNTVLPTLTNGQQAAQQVDSRGRQISVTATPVPLTVTQAALTIGTAAQRLTVNGATPALTRVAMVFTPDALSTAHFYIGSSTVTSVGATRGVEIVAGQAAIFNNDAGDYWVCADTAGQTGYVMEQE